MAPLPNPPDCAKSCKAPVSGLVAGVDEAGRGALAGPVVAAAVVSPDFSILSGLKDSKLCSPALREELEKKIRSFSRCWGIGVVWAPRIDRINILNATFEAMAMAIQNLNAPCKLMLIDGNRKIPPEILQKYGHAFPKSFLPLQKTIVKGDRLVPLISAASILAKTFRDRLMRSLSKKWPGYGFETHKGYGSQYHLEQIKLKGPTPQHRLTFRGV